jgi:hypothetical protein
MTAKIKLNAASGGGSFSLQAPSSSANNRVIALPDIADGTLLTDQSTGLGKLLQFKTSANGTGTDTGFPTYATNNINNVGANIGSSITINRISANSYFLITVSALIGRAATSGWGYLGYTSSFAGGSTNLVEGGRVADNASSVRYTVQFGNSTSGSVGDAVVVQARYVNSTAQNDNVRQATINIMEYQP